MKKPTLKITRSVLHWLSGEFILVDWDVPNGGAAVFLRSIFVSIIIFSASLVVINVIDPARSFEFSFIELQSQIVEHFQWFGVIFAGAYTAFYARFASQWSYLAELYNNIKSAEVSGAQNERALAQWKAGFIEDSQALHMECKSSFLSTVSAWLNDQKVAEAFVEHTIAGDQRLEELKENLEFSRDLVEKSYQSRLKKKPREGQSSDAA